MNSFTQKPSSTPRALAEVPTPQQISKPIQSWMLGRVPANQLNCHDWSQLKWWPGIHIAGENGYDNSREVAVDPLCVEWLVVHGLELRFDYNPIMPREKDISAYGLKEARRRACARFLQEAVGVICSSGIPGLEQCYRNAAWKFSLNIPLERVILNHDILGSDLAVRKNFARRLVFLGLNLIESYHSPLVLALLERDGDDLLRPFQNGYRDLSEVASEQGLSMDMIERLELQMISFGRGILELSGGRVECRQHLQDPEYTVNDNARICGSLIGISAKNQFGSFDSKQMNDVLLKSRAFTGDQDFSVLDAEKWSMEMMALLRIGFPEGYLYLPLELLGQMAVRHVDLIRIYFEEAYHQCPSLRLPGNNILLLLSWSSRVSGKPLEILTKWASMGKTSDLYQQLTRDFQNSQTTEQLGLIVIACVCHERLLPHSTNDTIKPIKGSYLADLDALLKGQTLSNKRTVFESIAFSFLRVLNTFDDKNINLIQLLATTLDKEAPLLDRFDGITDQYIAARIKDEVTHSSALEMVDCLELMELIQDNEKEWVISGYCVNEEGCGSLEPRVIVESLRL